MENRQEQKQGRKPLKDLTLLDRFLFDTAMSDPEISRNILSIMMSMSSLLRHLICLERASICIRFA